MNTQNIRPGAAYIELTNPTFIRKSRIPNGTLVEVDSAHFAQRFEGCVQGADWDVLDWDGHGAKGEWLYTVHINDGTVPRGNLLLNISTDPPTDVRLWDFELMPVSGANEVQP